MQSTFEPLQAKDIEGFKPVYYEPAQPSGREVELVILSKEPKTAHRVATALEGMHASTRIHWHSGTAKSHWSDSKFVEGASSASNAVYLFDLRESLSDWEQLIAYQPVVPIAQFLVDPTNERLASLPVSQNAPFTLLEFQNQHYTVPLLYKELGKKKIDWGAIKRESVQFGLGKVPTVKQSAAEPVAEPVLAPETLEAPEAVSESESEPDAAIELATEYAPKEDKEDKEPQVKLYEHDFSSRRSLVPYYVITILFLAAALGYVAWEAPDLWYLIGAEEQQHVLSDCTTVAVIHEKGLAEYSKLNLLASLVNNAKRFVANNLRELYRKALALFIQPLHSLNNSNPI